MDRAHLSAAPGSLAMPPDGQLMPACASCGGSIDLRPYGAALFCAECREMSDNFYRKDLYCDLGGGD